MFKFFISICLLGIGFSSFSQNRKIDTTLKIGKTGYRVFCTNKNLEKNPLSIRPIGFENTARDIDLMMKGRITKAEIDDFNNDGFPDLVVYVFSGEKREMGSVFAIASSENKTYLPIVFPDIRDDDKLHEGYRGYDDFSLLEGTLMRRFPIYKKDDTSDKPTGGKRVIQYQAIPGDRGALKFKVMHTYDLKE